MTDEDTDFEEQVKKIIKEYKAPENIEDELIEFLLGSGNVYSIIETYEETNTTSWED